MKLSLKKQRLKNQKSNIKEINTDKTALIAGGEGDTGLPRGGMGHECKASQSSRPNLPE